jgi:hypothetical protein
MGKIKRVRKKLAYKYPELAPVGILREVQSHSSLSKLYAEKTIGGMITRLTRTQKL